MTISLSVLGVSSFLLIILGILLKVETNRDERVLLRRFRAWFDQKVVALQTSLKQLNDRYGRGTFRIVFHFFAHLILAFLLKVLRWFERHVGRLQLHNKNVAKSVRGEKDKNHLDHIAEHKSSTALSDEEKQDLKDKSIGV